MPVFSRVRDGVLTLIVDGDYTANELRRVGFSAFEADDAPAKVAVILDLSGAAGLMNKAPAEVAASGAIFGAYRDRLTGIAVVAASGVTSLFDAQSDFAAQAGGRLGVFTSHADARVWLEGDS